MEGCFVIKQDSLVLRIAIVLRNMQDFGSSRWVRCPDCNGKTRTKVNSRNIESNNTTEKTHSNSLNNIVVFPKRKSSEILEKSRNLGTS